MAEPHLVEIEPYNREWPRLFQALGGSLREALGGVAVRIKRELAGQYRERRPAYTEAKAPITWEIMARADRWSQETGWAPGPSDA